MPTSEPSVTDAPTFTPGDVVKVPFPYTDRPTRQRRPALIVSGPDLQRTHGLSWLLMITSATHRGWEDTEPRSHMECSQVLVTA